MEPWRRAGERLRELEQRRLEREEELRRKKEAEARGQAGALGWRRAGRAPAG